MGRLSDTDLMPYGKYERKYMANVPPDYLLWCYREKKLSRAVREYVEDNRDLLEQEVKRINDKKEK